MTRAPFQILVYPYRKTSVGQIEYALLKSADEGYWQGIAGGGEDEEYPLETARRETFEESGILPYVMAGVARSFYAYFMKPSIPDTATMISLEGEHAVVRMKHEEFCSKGGFATMGLCKAVLMQVPPDDS